MPYHMHVTCHISVIHIACHISVTHVQAYAAGTTTGEELNTAHSQQQLMCAECCQKQHPQRDCQSRCIHTLSKSYNTVPAVVSNTAPCPLIEATLHPCRRTLLRNKVKQHAYCQTTPLPSMQAAARHGRMLKVYSFVGPGQVPSTAGAPGDSSQAVISDSCRTVGLAQNSGSKP